MQAPFKKLAEAVEKALGNEAVQLRQVAGKAKVELEERQKELREVGARLDAMAAAPINDDLKGADVDFKKTVNKALDAIAKSNNADLFGTAAADQLRSTLQGKAKNKSIVSDDANKPADKLKREVTDLRRDVRDALEKLRDFSKGIDDTADRLTGEASGLQGELVRLLDDATKSIATAAQPNQLRNAATSAGRALHVVDGLVPRTFGRLAPIDETVRRLNDFKASTGNTASDDKHLSAASQLNNVVTATGTPATREQKQQAQNLDRAGAALGNLIKATHGGRSEEIAAASAVVSNAFSRFSYQRGEQRKS